MATVSLKALSLALPRLVAWFQAVHAPRPVMLILALVEHLIYRVHTQRDQLQRYADTDPLTGLPNRRFLFEDSERMIWQCLASLNPVSLLLIDIDHFKAINDHHGHGRGDEVLRQVAQRMQHCVRDADLLARIGGEEFVVTLPGTDGAGAHLIARRILEAVSENGFKSDIDDVPPLRVTVSIGVASAEPKDHGVQLADLMKNADIALYRAKNHGRNRIEFAEEAGDESHRTGTR